MRDFHLPGRSATYATNGMCATSHPLAAKVAVQILESGGNAVDAAIAGAVVLGQCEPQMTGIGGDMFALISPAGSDEVIGLNGSGRAPAGFDAAALRAAGHTTIPVDSAHAVTVPGAVDAFCTLSRDHGHLGIATSLAPAIYYAEHGIPVAPRVASDWAKDLDRLQGPARDTYLTAGKAPLPGQIFRHPQTADVLRHIAMDGRDGFYDGEVAADMVATLQAAGGSHSLEDFANTACTFTTPISGSYSGLELLEHPPNGQGATAILLLNMLSHFDIASLDPLGAERLHLEAEATKLAYDARNRFMADPDATARLQHMLSADTAKSLAGLIRPDAVLPPALPGAEAVHRDTVYMTVVDRDRCAVSLIYSIFHSFGSGIASGTFGVLFQNRGAGFTLDEGHPNEAAPGKRPMHTIIPGMLRKDGTVLAPFGVMGGQYQSTGHARFVSNIADFGMGPQQALDAPRAFAEGGVLNVERGYGDDVRQTLADIGHTVAIPERAIGGAQNIFIGDHGVLIGGSDPRKDGVALGY